MYNDLNLKNWRFYKDVNFLTTNSLWISENVNLPKNSNMFKIPKRDNFPDNDSNFHGLFIPEIPYQMILRFTKENDIVWDCFGGSGTTYRVCKLLNRECIINDLNPKQDYIIKGNSAVFNPGKLVDLIIMHPPYYNIVKYSDDCNDGSSFKNLVSFLQWFKIIVKNVDQYLKEKRFLILVMGNIYLDGEEVDLGVICKDIVRGYGYKCKSHIIKDYGETKGKGKKNYNLNYVRQLRGNYNNFYGDNIFILEKQ